LTRPTPPSAGGDPILEEVGSVLQSIALPPTVVKFPGSSGDYTSVTIGRPKDGMCDPGERLTSIADLADSLRLSDDRALEKLLVADGWRWGQHVFGAPSWMWPCPDYPWPEAVEQWPFLEDLAPVVIDVASP
tara:strand:+ start:1762 stop:2157 length:396 start_codon:yes stop_codon:yes gene_type:complete